MKDVTEEIKNLTQSISDTSKLINSIGDVDSIDDLKGSLNSLKEMLGIKSESEENLTDDERMVRTIETIKTWYPKSVAELTMDDILEEGPKVLAKISKKSAQERDFIKVAFGVIKGTELKKKLAEEEKANNEFDINAETDVTETEISDVTNDTSTEIPVEGEVHNG